MPLKTSQDDLKKVSWEATEVAKLFTLLQTSEEGLGSKEAAARLSEFGSNKLPDDKRESALVKFLKQFNNALIYVLLAAALLTAVLGHWIDTGVILAVVVINSFIGYIQESKAEKALDSIKHLLSLKSAVIRDGIRTEIAAEDLTIGDLVLLKAGDKVPADMRLLEVNNLRVDEASLTGESEAVAKQVDPVSSGTVLGDRRSMAYTGTTVRQGSGSGVIVAVGTYTELGKINRMLSETKAVTTPLIRKINSFGKSLSVAIIGFALAVLLYGYFVQGFSWAEGALAVIGLAVAAIPEGLPAILTVTLAIGVQAMARRNAIVRNLPSVETLGSVTVICSDKTGTLTKNEMTATRIYTTAGRYDIEGAGYQPKGNIRKNNKSVNAGRQPELERLLQAAYLSNDSQLTEKDGQWQVDGSPTDGALMALALKGGMDSIEAKRLFIIPFDSEYKYIATMNSLGREKMLFVSGAPERLLAMSGSQLNQDGDSEEIDSDFWQEKIEAGASDGLRMLGLAYRQAGELKEEFSHDDLKGKLTFLGVAGLIDPPRPEAIEAVRLAGQSGIRVKMITGDHALTARVIASQMGIGDGVKVISGAEIEEMDDKELEKAAAECDVFARTSPEHKLRLVKALQNRGEICAMTGDGVNDAPALKKADIGIAMGIKGTEVTKDAAAMVLADDNFASIIAAVEEGRTIYDNLRKTLLFLLPVNGAESFVILAAIILGLTLPVTPVQILWVNMISAVTMAVSLAFEPTEKNTMNRPPRDPRASMLGIYFAFRVLFVSLLIGGSTFFFFTVLENNPAYNLDTARTIAVNAIVFGELFYLFNCRRLDEPALGGSFFQNKVTFISCGAMLVLQLSFTYLPFMNVLFETSPLAPVHWLYIVALGMGVFILVEIEKKLTKPLRDKN